MTGAAGGLPYDAAADRLVTSFVTMLTTSEPDHFDATVRSVLVSFRRYFDVEGLRFTYGPTVLDVGRLEGVVERVVRGGTPRRDTMTLELSGSRGQPVTPATMAIARAVTSAAAVVADGMATGRRLRHVAAHDELTGVLNRGTFTRLVDERLTAGPTTAMVLLRCDVDRLTAVNATFGSDAGDVVLRVTARRLRETVGEGALVGRVGGDEFAVLLPHPDHPHLLTGAPDNGDGVLGPRLAALAGAIHAGLSRPVTVTPRRGAPSGDDTETVETAEIVRTTTVGIATTDGTLAPAELVRRVVQATALGKRRGGGTTVRYDASMSRTDRIRGEVELRLPQAIRDDELTLYYQPEVDLRTTTVVGAEALVRWNHPALGLLLPDSFIETVETSPYALRFGRWVLEHACTQWAAWLERFDWDRSAPPRVRVNITASQLMHEDFVADVAGVLMQTGLPAAALGLEITERDVVRDQVTAERTLLGLAGLGVTVALDDFGTGYSTFAQLRDFTVAAVKIDRSFVATLASDATDRSIVTAVVSLARSLGLGVIAEGVEDQGAADLLVAMGCLRGQGFLYGRPLPPETIADVLAAGATGVAPGGATTRP